MPEAPIPASPGPRGSPAPDALAASYFDGSSARAHAVTLRLQDGRLWIDGAGVARQVPLADVSWPERTRHGLRVAHFKDGGSVQCADAQAWDAWSRGSGLHEPLVVRLQQSWRWVALCALLLVAIGVALQQRGLPAAARAVVALAPPSVDAALGASVLPFLDEHLMRPSKLAPQEQARLRAALSRALQATQGASSKAESLPAWNLVFRQSHIGPNALALPGGTLIMTDELVELVRHDENVIVAVLAHEMGHVRRRHGLRMMVQVAMLSALSALVLGDFSSLLAGAPVLLGHASYSRAAEREADLDAVHTLRAAGISPAVMLTLFESLEQLRQSKEAGARPSTGDPKPPASKRSGMPGEATDQGSWLGIAFASHPTDAERIRFFKDAATPPPTK
jgi:Zn-dependent protease with chaperone function